VSISVDIMVSKPKSTVSGRLLADIARANGGDAEEPATGDPTPAGKRRASKA
jgi:hypothetical protein